MVARGARVTTLDAQHGVDMPEDAAGNDGLLILGGAMNAYDDARCRHFPALLDLARLYAAKRKPVLGICLGGQLLARAWGAKVHLGAAPEFGVALLAPTAAVTGDALFDGIDAAIPAMQWHDDTFDLPDGAVSLLTGEACRNQAFRVAHCVWAFQCHFEADRRDMIAWAEYRRDVYGYDDFVTRLVIEAATHGDAAEAFGRRIADRWLDLVDHHRPHAPAEQAAGTG